MGKNKDKHLRRYHGIVDEGFVYCKLCQQNADDKLDHIYGIPMKERRFYELEKHLSSYHGISPEKYLEMFPGALLRCRDYEDSHKRGMKQFWNTTMGEELKDKYRKNMLDKSKNPMYNVIYRTRCFEKCATQDRKDKIGSSLKEQYKCGIRAPPDNFFYKGIHGKYHSQKTNKDIKYDSLHELAAYKLLDRDDEVISYERGPKIPLPENRTYFTDLLVTYKSGRKVVVEIKMMYEVECVGSGRERFVLDGRSPFTVKIECAEEYCKEKGLDFEIWTDKCMSNYFN